MPPRSASAPACFARVPPTQVRVSSSSRRLALCCLVRLRRATRKLSPCTPTSRCLSPSVVCRPVFRHSAKVSASCSSDSQSHHSADFCRLSSPDSQTVTAHAPVPLVVSHSLSVFAFAIPRSSVPSRARCLCALARRCVLSPDSKSDDAANWPALPFPLSACHRRSCTVSLFLFRHVLPEPGVAQTEPLPERVGWSGASRLPVPTFSPPLRPTLFPCRSMGYRVPEA